MWRGAARHCTTPAGGRHQKKADSTTPHAPQSASNKRILGPHFSICPHIWPISLQVSIVPLGKVPLLSFRVGPYEQNEQAREALALNRLSNPLPGVNTEIPGGAIPHIRKSRGFKNCHVRYPELAQSFLAIACLRGARTSFPEISTTVIIIDGDGVPRHLDWQWQNN